MHHHQSDSDSSDDSMDNPPTMKSTVDSQRRRRSSNEQTDELSDITQLREELNRLHEEISPECNKHIKKMTDIVDDFEKDYRHAFNRTAIIAGGLGIGGLVLGIALAAFTAGASLVVSGIGAVTAAAVAVGGVVAVGGGVVAVGGAVGAVGGAVGAVGGAVGAVGGAVGAVGGGVAYVIGYFRKKQQEKNLRQTIEKEIEEFQNKISPVINILEKIFNCAQEILKDPTLSKHKANAIHECFTCFERIHLFQRDSSREGARKHLTADLSEFFSEMNSVLAILEEIIEDKEEQNDNDNPEETPAPKQIDEKEFKEKADKFIHEMRKGIDHLKNVMNEIDLTKGRLLKD